MYLKALLKSVKDYTSFVFASRPQKTWRMILMELTGISFARTKTNPVLTKVDTYVINNMNIK